MLYYGTCISISITCIIIGLVKLLKGSVASSPREKRNERKRSFEQCMSATAAKILKMEQERETSAGEKVNSWYDGM